MDYNVPLPSVLSSSSTSHSLSFVLHLSLSLFSLHIFHVPTSTLAFTIFYLPSSLFSIAFLLTFTPFLDGAKSDILKQSPSFQS